MLFFVRDKLQVFLVLAIVLSGCVTVPPTEFVSSIDSLAASNALLKKRYILIPGGKGIDVTDLQFQEFSNYLDRSLSESGFVKAGAFENADIAILVSYAIGDPQTYQYTYSLPTYGQTGVSSANTSGTVSSYGGMANYSSTTSYTPAYGITGSTTHIGTNTVYTRFLVLDAYDVEVYARDKKLSSVWKSSVVSTGSSNDLRLVMPYMVTAMSPYLGINTGKKIEIHTRVDDQKVKVIRGDKEQPKKHAAQVNSSLE